jgi:sulfatase maturation enzyme AslB (radical SAM superfamily)
MVWLRLHVSNLCNFACPNCHVFELTDNQRPYKVMTYEVAEQALITFCKEMGQAGQSQIRISIYGGETLANKKVIKALIEKFGSRWRDLELFWVLNTNGSLLTEEDVLFFVKHEVDIHISCDGKEEVHNRARPDKVGRGTFKRVEAAFELLKRHQASRQINSYTMPENVNHLKDLVDLAVEQDISRIYLDAFYSENMLDPQRFYRKYKEVYYYGLQKGVTITGPWHTILTNIMEKRSQRDREELFFATDVNVDGTFYLSYFPLTKRSNWPLAELAGFFSSSVYKKICKQALAFYDQSCAQCPLRETCFGRAIQQVHYHVEKEEGYEVNCEFTRRWISTLTKPTYYFELEQAIVFSQYPEENAKVFLKKLKKNLLVLQKTFGPPSEKIRIVLYDNQDDFEFQTSRLNLPSWVRGVAVRPGTYFQVGETASETLIHELTHLFLWQKSSADLPPWVSEGICEYMRSPKSNQQVLKKISRKKSLRSLKDLSQQEDLSFLALDADPTETNICYQQSQNMIHFLVNRHGWSQVLKLLSHRDEPFSRRFKKVYGFSLSQFETDWSDYFQKRTG